LGNKSSKKNNPLGGQYKEYINKLKEVAKFDKTNIIKMKRDSHANEPYLNIYFY